MDTPTYKFLVSLFALQEVSSDWTFLFCFERMPRQFYERQKDKKQKHTSLTQKTTLESPTKKSTKPGTLWRWKQAF